MSEDRARRDFDEMVSRPLPSMTFWGWIATAAPAAVALIVAGLVAWFVLVAVGVWL